MLVRVLIVDDIMIFLALQVLAEPAPSQRFAGISFATRRRPGRLRYTCEERNRGAANTWHLLPVNRRVSRRSFLPGSSWPPLSSPGSPIPQADGGGQRGFPPPAGGAWTSSTTRTAEPATCGASHDRNTRRAL